ncbi:MAG: hypothetical protein KA152_01290 [Verrucomicrobiales bacterium]|nr:hypothetical protein [Verrucomicrobiales bacterium]
MSYKLITFRAEASEKILREADALHSIRSAWVENINAIVEKGGNHPSPDQRENHLRARLSRSNHFPL